MFIKLFHMLSLFAYLNTITYENGETTEKNTFAGDSVLEFVLNDIMNIPMNNLVDDIEVPNDSYRLFNSTIPFMPAILLLLSVFLPGLIEKIRVTEHPLYKTKSTCLPTYYTHLFRFKPF